MRRILWVLFLDHWPMEFGIALPKYFHLRNQTANLKNVRSSFCGIFIRIFNDYMASKPQVTILSNELNFGNPETLALKTLVREKKTIIVSGVMWLHPQIIRCLNRVLNKFMNLFTTLSSKNAYNILQSFELVCCEKLLQVKSKFWPSNNT